MSFLRRLFRYFRTPESGAWARFVSTFLSGASWFTVVAFWLCALTPYIDPRHFGAAAAYALLFPLLLGSVLAMGVLCLVFAPRRVWIPLFGLLVASGSIRTYAPINLLGSPSTGVAEGEIRVMTYNTRGFGLTDSGRAEMTRYMIASGAQIIAFQEGMGSLEHNKQLVARLKHTQIPHYKCYNAGSESLGVISTYRVTDAQLISRSGGNIIVAFWLKVPDEQPWIVVNCHLRSNALTYDERGKFSQWTKTGENPDSGAWKRRLYDKITLAAAARAEMVDTLSRFVKEHRDQVKFICGDFNDTPISSARHRLVDLGFNDAFRAAGNGISRTFNRDAMYVRIDHLLADPQFEAVEAHVDNKVYLSDHYPVIATFRRTRR